MKKQYDIEGMTCASCQVSVEKAVKKLGDVEVSVSLLTHSMEVKSDKEIDTNQIISAVENAGYFAKEKYMENKNSKRENPKQIIEKELSDIKKRLKISFPLMILLMYVAMGEMMRIPYPSIFSGVKNAGIFIFTQFLIALPILYYNRNYFINGFKALLHLSPNMDSLVAIGSMAGVIYGIFTAYMIFYALGISDTSMVHKYMHDIYFESSTMIITLITFGKYLEVRSKSKTTDAINKLIEIQPDSVVVVEDGIEKNVLVEDVKKGDILKIIPGERIAVDGVVLKGYSSIDQSAITGESIPVEVNIGSRIISGGINKNGSFLMEATNVGNDSTISKIITLMEEASSTKAPISKIADKVSGVFVPVVISISAISFIVWYLMGYGFEFAFSIGIGVLVISCPCALGLATPVAMMVSTGKAAENGILVKNQESLENLHKIDYMIFDKTGTITQGKPIIKNIIFSKNFDKSRIIDIAYSIENMSQQPLAESIVNYAKENGANLIEVSEFESIDGKGVRGNIENIDYYIGSEKLLIEKGLNFEVVREKTTNFSKEGKTVVYLFTKHEILCIFAISDSIKNTSIQAISRIKSMGIKTIMLTGDNKITAKAISDKINIDEFEAELLPQDKDKIVKKYQEKGKVCMVGDGINDALALIRSDIGIAIADGTDIAIDSADLVLMKSNLYDIVNAINLSKKTIKIIKENLFWAFFYNVLSIPLAMGVFYIPFGIKLNPMVGAFAMSMSSFFVVTNSLRIKNFNQEKINFETLENKDNNVKIESVYIEKSTNNREEFMNKKIVSIEGMSCNHCVMSVKKAVKSVDEQIDVNVSLENKNATLESEKEIDYSKIRKVIEEAGFKVLEIK